MSNRQQVGAGLISELEKARKSKVIVYCTGDRQPLGAARIAEDAVRPLYDHLINLDFESETKTIEMYVYSRGGDVSVPWRIASMVREFCDEFNFLIPYKAHSAATLLSLGADNIIMGRKAELGPSIRLCTGRRPLKVPSHLKRFLLRTLMPFFHSSKTGRT